MATNKTLNPTGVTIAIPAMADKPDASVFSNCIDKEADAINMLNSNIGTVPHILTFTVPANGSITITKAANGLPNAYIVTSRGGTSGTIAAAIGVGYGMADVRHKIVNLIEAIDISFAPASNTYGLVISSGDNVDRQIYITPLQL